MLLEVEVELEVVGTRDSQVNDLFSRQIIATKIISLGLESTSEAHTSLI